jgi:hypothetical protein
MIRPEAICDWRTSKGLRKRTVPGMAVAYRDGRYPLTNEESRHCEAGFVVAEGSSRAGRPVEGGVRPVRASLADAESSPGLDLGSSLGRMTS